MENRTEKNYQTNLLSQKPLVFVHARYYMILFKEKYSTKKTLNICSDPQKMALMLLLIKFHPLHKPRRYTINIVSRRSLWLLMLLWIHFGYKKYLHIWFVWILQLHFASCLPAHQVCRAAGADTMGTSLCNYVQCSQQKENWILRPQLKTLQDILMLLIFCNFALQNVQFERQ